MRILGLSPGLRTFAWSLVAPDEAHGATIRRRGHTTEQFIGEVVGRVLSIATRPPVDLVCLAEPRRAPDRPSADAMGALVDRLESALGSAGIAVVTTTGRHAGDDPLRCARRAADAGVREGQMKLPLTDAGPRAPRRRRRRR